MQSLLSMENKGSPLCGYCLFQSAAYIIAEFKMLNHGIISGAQRESLSTVYTCVALCASGERRKWLHSTESVLSKRTLERTIRVTGSAYKILSLDYYA